MDADINFDFDPICPFAWMTSKWVRMVQAQRGYNVDWRFISLRLINASVDYDDDVPTENAGQRRGTREFVEPILAEAGLPLSLAEALDDESWDREIRQETDEALGLTGKDVGTPTAWRSSGP
ncbi:hypothetical protein ACFFGR_10910 [Arthrobacter liuii]|uniref:DSBA-like thioredoxin domain-containing protein n=1 Tax=Arthrobacter liuii TaxID=1476996 RepID=A0ABQ2AYM4_9MICC|nr:hypothetical protein [Arthrobacter liuii]GGH98830.1 hypothetical protein GCM10007170_32270 [Arthrobacter liuii]